METPLPALHFILLRDGGFSPAQTPNGTNELAASSAAIQQIPALPRVAPLALRPAIVCSLPSHADPHQPAPDLAARGEPCGASSCDPLSLAAAYGILANLPPALGPAPAPEDSSSESVHSSRVSRTQLPGKTAG